MIDRNFLFDTMFIQKLSVEQKPEKKLSLTYNSKKQAKQSIKTILKICSDQCIVSIKSLQKKPFVFFSLSNPLIKISSKRSYLYIIHLIARLSLYSKLSKIFILLNCGYSNKTRRGLLKSIRAVTPHHLEICILAKPRALYTEIVSYKK